MEERPTAIRALVCANISGDARLQLRLDLPEIVLKQNELGRDGRIGLKFEDPMSVGVLQRHQRLATAEDRIVQPRSMALAAERPGLFRGNFIHGDEDGIGSGAVAIDDSS